MQIIKIQTQKGAVVFNPKDQLIDLVTDGGAFFFENEDSQAHQPQPDKGGTWVDSIAPGKPSSVISTITPGSYPYTCALHPAEKGVVTAPHVITLQTQLMQTGFNPANQAVTPATDSGLIVFLNLDQTLSHRPVPTDPGIAPWFTQDIAPGQYSPIVAITNAGTYHYQCANHATEKGTVTVSGTTT